MKPVTILLIASLSALLPLATAQQAEADSGVRALVANYMAARNSRDPAAVRALFTPDADQLVSSGEWRKGIDALVSGAIASSQKESGNSRLIVDSIRSLSSDIALADCRYEVPLSDGGVRKMWSSIIARKTDAGWRIAAIRNMLPAPR